MSFVEKNKQEFEGNIELKKAIQKVVTPHI